MTDIFGIVETGLYSRLTTYAAGTAFYGTRVYADQAPQGATRPYIVFYHVAGGDENNTPTRTFNFHYHAECVADTLAEARTGAGHIDGALHHQTLTISGYTNFWTVNTGLFRQLDDVQGIQFWRRGATYQIRAG